MSQFRFNQLFVILMAAGLLGAFAIPPSITDRAKGKEEVLLIPIVKPVRAVVEAMHSKYGGRTAPPGEQPRPDADVAAENFELKRQILFLTHQLEDLRLVEADRKKLGPLLKYLDPVSVLAGDATPGRESIALTPTSDVDMAPGTAVLGGDGLLVGRLIAGRRVRLITDKDYTVTGQFGRWDKEKWTPLPVPKPSVRGIGNGAMRIDNLTREESLKLQTGDWVVLADNEYPSVVQDCQVGQVESIRPLPSKPLFAEIIVKPRADLRKLQEVFIVRKQDR